AHPGPARACRVDVRARGAATRRGRGVTTPQSSLVPERPQSGPPRPWRFPPFERCTVAGGTVLAVDLPGQPLASLLLVVDAGAIAEPAGKEGVALLTARALGEGTELRDADGFAVAGEQL